MGWAGGGALAGDSREQHAAALGIRGIGADVSRQRRGIVDGQVWAAQHAHGDLAVDHERQAHGVLAAAQEALGTVNGVDSPYAALGAPGALAIIQPV